MSLSTSIPEVPARAPSRRRWGRIVCGIVGAAGFLLLVVSQTGFTVGMPFEGGGYDAKRGVVVPGVGDTVLVVVVQAKVDVERREPFDDHIFRVWERMNDNDGYVGGSIRKVVFGDEAWTLSVWRDEEALLGFVGSDAHLEAIHASVNSLHWTRTVHYEMPASEVPPNWDDALARLRRDGETTHY